MSVQALVPIRLGLFPVFDLILIHYFTSLISVFPLSIERILKL